MGEALDDSTDIDTLYQLGERLNGSEDKSQNEEDYLLIIGAASGGMKARQLAAQLIPKFFKYFPKLQDKAFDQHAFLLTDEELGVRVQAIRGLPLFCKDTAEWLFKIADVLAQLLVIGEIVERDAVHKALMTLLRQDVKTSLTALFKRIGSTGGSNAEESINEAEAEASSDESIREKVICFIRDKVFPLKSELLRPQEQLERHITDLVKQNLQDVAAEEFKMFMDFLKSLSLFGQNAPVEHIKELLEIVEGQADLDAQFNVSDGEHISRLILCLHMALPLFTRGASSSKFLTYVIKHILPVFDKLPEQRKLDLLKNLAECSHYVTPQDSRQLLPSVVQFLKKCMVRKKIEEMNFTSVECLLYTLHHLAHKTPNTTNSLCGYKIVTGQPSDRLGEDFSDCYKDFNERLGAIEDMARAMIKKLTQGMAKHNKAMAAAKTEEEKNNIKTEKQNATTGLRSCNNILAMAQPLHSKAPVFIGDWKINLSWKEATKPSVSSIASVIGQKRTAGATNGSGSHASKRARADGVENQLIHKALESLYGGGRTGGRGRGWRIRGRGRGRGYC